MEWSALKYINKVPDLKDARVDVVILCSKYPVLFSMCKENKEYLVCCPVYNSEKIVWIVIEVSYDVIVDLLIDKITIRNAFELKDNNYLIEVKDKSVNWKKVKQFPDEYLPTEGEYMESEDREFKEEIQYYQQRKSCLEFK